MIVRHVVTGCGLICLGAVPVAAQTTPPAVPPNPAITPPPPAPPVTGPAGVPANGPGEQGAAPAGPLAPDQADITYEDAEFDGSRVRAHNVVMALGEYTLRGGLLEGDFDHDLILTGNPSVTYRGQTLAGERIRFTVPKRAYEVDRPHIALAPEFLRDRITSPVFVTGERVRGQARHDVTGDNVAVTTCDKPRKDYVIVGREILLEPGKRVVMRHATIYLWGAKLITVPTFVVPLEQDRRNLSWRNAPRFGRSVDEGWFAKSSFGFLTAGRAPGVLRVDAMEKKGLGLGVDQAWQLAKAAGLFTLYAIPTSTNGNNLSGRFSNRQNIGGGSTITLDNDFQQNSYLALPQTRTFNTRLGFNRMLDGLSTTLNLSRMATDSSGSNNHSYAANLSQGFTLGQGGTVNLGADFTRYSSGYGGSFYSLTQQLATHLQADQRASNYTLEVAANKNVPMGGTQSFFSGVEKLPEVTLSNYRFTQGDLSKLPLTLMVSAGQYSEGGGTTNGTRFVTNRAIGGFDLNGMRYKLTGSTDLNVSSGFQQYFYGDGSAQYILRNNTSLTQRWGRHSGVNFNYVYQRPEGGTPFRFDQLGNSHSLSADAGWLDDRRLQLTARVGYDFSRTSLGGLPAQPWQTLSANLLVRPWESTRIQTLFSFDPNTGKFYGVTNDFRLRSSNDLAVDLVSKYDPQVHKIGAVNGYLNIPVGGLWRAVALFQYNGYLNRFESRNLQITRDLHCLEATLTYTDNPYGYRTDRQLMFSLRVKAFPVFERFGTGQYGQAIGGGIGSLY